MEKSLRFNPRDPTNTIYSCSWPAPTSTNVAYEKALTCFARQPGAMRTYPMRITSWRFAWGTSGKWAARAAAIQWDKSNLN